MTGAKIQKSYLRFDSTTAKKCMKCGKLLRKHNKSGKCQYCLIKEFRKKYSQFNESKEKKQ